MVVAGSVAASDDALTLVARALHQGSFGTFFIARNTGLVPLAGGGQGTLCLGGAIGRYNRPGEVGATGVGDSFSLRLTLASTPSPSGALAIVAGDTWSFQAWYRDANPAVTSNLTDAITVVFR